MMAEYHMWNDCGHLRSGGSLRLVSHPTNVTQKGTGGKHVHELLDAVDLSVSVHRLNVVGQAGFAFARIRRKQVTSLQSHARRPRATV